MNCTACGESFDFEYKLDEHHNSTGHIGKTDAFKEAKERRKSVPDRRTATGRFSLHAGPGRLQTVLNPELVFQEHCPRPFIDRYKAIRAVLDGFMVDIAAEAVRIDEKVKSR
jgi:hypothetical protein